MAGRECSLGARCQGIVARPPRYVARVFRGAPRLAPLCRRSSTGRVGPTPGPPCPLPFYCIPVCCRVLSGRLWCIHRVCVVGGGARGPSVVLRPRLCRADAGCRPMCPVPRLRPATACVRGRGVRVGPLLGSLRSLRFKWALLRAPAPPRFAVACCARLQARFGARFCNFCVTNP